VEGTDVGTVETRAVERELEIAASPETVWELLTDPEQATSWMGQTASFDLRPGGAYRVEVLPENVASGAFVEIDPPHRLVFTWGWEVGVSSVAPGTTTVEFELVATESGTLLRFAHRDLPSADAAVSHSHGWDHYLGRLVTVAGGGDAGPDEWLTEMPS
jgi:uncharacterized protein YndB with AHSA1/START domain